MDFDWDRAVIEIAERNRAMSDSVDPAKVAARLDEARKLAVREGWSDEEGNSLLPEDADEDEQGEEA